MNERKTMTRIFTIADYYEEEKWLHEQHLQGWKLVKMTPPVSFTFERCEPEDVIYRLEFTNQDESGDYFRMYEDFGWEYVTRCIGWNYFRKSASQTSVENDGQLFSEDASKLDMIRKIMTKRMLPLLCIFLCCIVPNLSRCLNRGMDGFAIFFAVMFCIYIFLLVYCTIRLLTLKKRIEDHTDER